MESQAKTKYRIRNWSNYNKAMVQRGSLTIWFSGLTHYNFLIDQYYFLSQPSLITRRKYDEKKFNPVTDKRFTNHSRS